VKKNNKIGEHSNGSLFSFLFFGFAFDDSMPKSKNLFAALFILLMICVGLALFLVKMAGTAPKAMSAVQKSALVVVDAQVGVLASVWESTRVINNLESLVRKARSAGVPVIWVQHSDKELQYGTEPWNLAPNFVPLASEVVIHKNYNSSFADTELDERLKSIGVTRIVLAGAASNWCIRATAYAAVDRGYHLTLVGDAHSTEPIQLADGKVVAAEAIVADLNTVFQFFSAPVVSTEVVTTQAVSFK
jgi:nicotinamidase-related amidase